MIRLTCPGCQATLEVDRGFERGVCRCFKCGTLMTVPGGSSGDRRPGADRPERPDVPDQPEPIHATQPSQSQQPDRAAEDVNLPGPELQKPDATEPSHRSMARTVLLAVGVLIILGLAAWLGLSVLRGG